MFTSRRRTYTPTRMAGLALVVLGVLAVVAGIVALVFPGLTLFNLVIIFGWFAIITGIVEIVHAVTGDRTNEARAVLGVWGLATLVLGLLALILPGLTVGAFVLLIAAYFLVTGVAQIIASFRGHLHGWLLVWGVLGVLAGLVALVYPGIAALTLAIIFGVYALLGGISALGAGIAILSGHDTPTISLGRMHRAG